jgi:HPt (histidine-containing phosphotransfer) domain-containing protein
MTLGPLRTNRHATSVREMDSLASGHTRKADEAFDYTEALRRVEGDRAFLGEIAADFIADYPDTLASIRDALSRTDREALTFSAHKMNGALATLSAGPARAAARWLEEVSDRGDLAAAAEALRALEGKLDALVPALTALQAKVLGVDSSARNDRPTASKR